eukprot:6111640-Pyramimonas_sp.AAC.1
MSSRDFPFHYVPAAVKQLLQPWPFSVHQLCEEALSAYLHPATSAVLQQHVPFLPLLPPTRVFVYTDGTGGADGSDIPFVPASAA